MYVRSREPLAFPIGLPPETVARMQERAGNHQAAARTRANARGLGATCPPGCVCCPPGYRRSPGFRCVPRAGTELARHRRAGMVCPPLTHCTEWQCGPTPAGQTAGSSMLGFAVGIGALIYLVTRGARPH